MPKIKLPEFESVWGLVNQDAVREAIFTPKRDGRVPKYGLDDLANIDEMLESACRKWLVRDLVELQIDAVEERSDFAVLDHTVKCYIDVEATIRNPVVTKSFEPFLGKKLIIDWKTREGALDQPWRERCIDSWQWRIYAASRGAQVVSYRGISRRCEEEDGLCETKEILIGVHASCTDEVVEQATGLLVQRDALIAAGLTVWPRNMRDACFKYGYECPFKLDCDRYEMPKYVPNPKREMSYTAFGNFMRCQEFSRRMENAPDGTDSSEESQIGTGFHSGVASIYMQLKGVSL